MARKIDPAVQAYYDALDDAQKADLDRRMVEAGRTLADLRIARSTGKLDERLLVPKVIVPNKFTNGHTRDKSPNGDIEDDEPETEDKPAGSAKRRKGEKLPADKDLAAYIKDELGDGRALADFYIDIVTMTNKQAKKAGVWMNHKLQAAAWLGDRGWGKAKGDDDGVRGITINLVDHSGVDVVKPPLNVNMDESHTQRTALPIEKDVPRDNPRSEAVRINDDGVVEVELVDDEPSKKAGEIIVEVEDLLR
jgi:hypothetical protein